MSTFLEKNKKKGALAALLLFIRTRKTLTALLVLVALASFLFVSPSNLILSFPGGTRVAAGVAWMAGKVGVNTSRWGLVGGKRDYGDLVAAFHAAKEGGGKAGWSAFMRGGEAAEAGKIGGSSGSLGFVKGNAKDLEATGGSGAKLEKRGSVEGVLNPDDAKNRGEGEGVALSEGDVSGERAGLVKSAFAGGFGSVTGGGAAPGGAFAAAGFFGGKGAASGKLGDLVKNGVDGIDAQPGKGVQVQGGAKGQLSASRASQIKARTSRGLAGSHTISGQRAFVQLAAGRGRAAISVSPNCTPGSGCPGEFAATNTGAVYDGNTISGERTDILTAPEIDGISSPNVPSTGMADDYVRDAEKMDADARKCRELDDKYGPTELAYDQQQQRESEQFNSMGCGQGGCSKSKAKACQRMGDQMKATCRAAMTVRCAHTRECPLTANNRCSPSDCDGAARNKTQVVQVNDGVRTRTVDQGDAVDTTPTNLTTDGESGPSCVDAEKTAVQHREATQKAIDQYRGNGCESLYSEQTLSGSAKYEVKCRSSHKQVLRMCSAYANALCQIEQNTCHPKECSGDETKCDISNLKGIEEFINY